MSSFEMIVTSLLAIILVALAQILHTNGKVANNLQHQDERQNMILRHIEELAEISRHIDERHDRFMEAMQKSIETNGIMMIDDEKKE